MNLENTYLQKFLDDAGIAIEPEQLIIGVAVLLPISWVVSRIASASYRARLRGKALARTRRRLTRPKRLDIG